MLGSPVSERSGESKVVGEVRDSVGSTEYGPTSHVVSPPSNPQWKFEKCWEPVPPPPSSCPSLHAASSEEATCLKFLSQKQLYFLCAPQSFTVITFV